MFVGCSEPDESSFDGIWLESTWVDGTWLDGKWESTFDDSYTIDTRELTLKYDDGWDSGYSGNISGIMLFNNNGSAGVIIIEYTDKPYYFGTEDQPIGNYIGVYFRNLTKTQGEFTTASTEADRIPAKATLDEAKKTFTIDTVGNFTLFWGTYEK
jgi:hypothetical protein